MPAWTRTTVVPGDRVTVEIPHSTRSALRPLVGLLRTVEVIDHTRAVILSEDGTRSVFRGRPLPPVALVQVSIVTDPETGTRWARKYQLPPREHSPHPIPARYLAAAEPDGRGGIARMSTCWCGSGCGCPTCGEPIVTVPARSGLEWSTRPCPAGAHPPRRCVPSTGTTTPVSATGDGPDCCALPMMLAPIAWVCRRESAHQRPYQWPEHPIPTS